MSETTSFEPSVNEAFNARIAAALSSDVPKLYINAFVNAQSTGDVLTVLECNGQPVATLNMSFTVAKTLSIALGFIVARLEEQTGREMLTTNELEKIFAAEGPSK